MATIKKLLTVELFRDKGYESHIDTQIRVSGWVRTCRLQKHICFITLYDGTCHTDLQVVADIDLESASEVELYETLKPQLTTGTALSIVGTLVRSPAKGQVVELKTTSIADITLVGTVGDGYLMSKNRHSRELLRDHPTYRVRAKTMAGVQRMRSACAFATHNFFRLRHFQYVHTPLITGSDCEGAGEAFRVTTLMGEDTKIADLPRKHALMSVEKTAEVDWFFEKISYTATEDVEYETGEIDDSKDFFGGRSYLTVSGQLQVESYASAMSRVYTFGPTFRAEHSHTSRHLAEFWMIEPEMCFIDFEDLQLFTEEYIQYCVKYVLDTLPDEIDFFDRDWSKKGGPSKGLRERLELMVAKPFKRITYTQAIKELIEDHEMVRRAKKKDPVSEFKYPKPEGWGIDMGSEQEKYLTHKYGPLIVTHYPKKIKAFYMKQTPTEKDTEMGAEDTTVEAMDVLIPGIGEMVGGSMREDSYDVLEKTITDMGLPVKSLKWYLDLRKYGSVPHGGFGLGFERLIMYATGMENIKDAIPFPCSVGRSPS
jgi:asparaginyl-tRNA synthetase